MRTMAQSAQIRAYINPLPGYSEAAQRADILKEYGTIREWYVESNNVKREDFIRHLRKGDQAVVAHLGCLAKSHGRIDSRIADLSDARGDIHGKGSFVTDCDGNASNQSWPNAQKAARKFLLAQRSIKNGSARKHRLTDTQVKRVLEIRDSKRYTNDAQRLTALKKEGIEIGRTYMVTMVPIIARERGITI